MKGFFIQEVNMNGFLFIRGLILAIIFLVPISTVFSYFGISGVILSVCLFCIYLLFSGSISAELTYGLIVLMVIVLFSMIPIFYHSDVSRMTYLLPFIVSFLMVFFVPDHDLNAFAEISTSIMVLFLLGAIFGFFWVIVGGSSLADFTNPDGRVVYVFPFTLSNSYWGDFIRASSIYDEPGALSFFVCALVTVRHILGFCEKKSFILLILGLVTLSLAHIVFLVFYVLSMQERIKYIWISTVSLFFLICIIYFLGVFDIFYNVFLIRFEITDYSLHGDNRTDSLIRVFEYLSTDLEAIFMGQSSYFLQNPFSYFDKVGGGYEVGANPLNLISKFGIFGAFAYIYIVISLVFSWQLGRRWLAVFAFVLLMLQRDYIFVVSYSFAMVMVFRIVMLKVKSHDVVHS